MDLNHIKNLTETQAEIRLFDTIGAAGSTGSEIADEIAWLLEHAKVEEILVRINSGGGSMIEGFGIFSALLNAKKKGVRVNVQIEGLAASMAGIIAMAGDKISMIDFGLLMIHDPHLGGIEPNDKQREILEKFKSSAVTITSNRTGIGSEEISEMMSVETWLDAEEALAKGFIDEIITSEIDNKKKETQHMAFMEIAMSLSNKPKTKKMDKVISHLELDAEASQEDVINGITKIKNELKEAQDKVTELDGLVESKNKTIEANIQEIADLKEKVEGSDAEKVGSILEAAVEAGKIKADAVEDLAELFGADVEKAEKMINSIPEAKVNVLKDFIKNDSGKAGGVEMSFRDMEKKDPAKLEEIKANDPELYKQMYRDQYGAEIVLD